MLLGNTFMILVPGQNILDFQQLKAECFANKISLRILIFQSEKKTKKEILTLLRKKTVTNPKMQKKIYIWLGVFDEPWLIFSLYCRKKMMEKRKTPSSWPWHQRIWLYTVILYMNIIELLKKATPSGKGSSAGTFKVHLFGNRIGYWVEQGDPVEQGVLGTDTENISSTPKSTLIKAHT